jgi:site-specific DNA-methyltransferase (adenine-specific)
MEIIEKRLSELKPYEKNPRRNDEAVKYVAESIKQFGFKVPIVIDRKNIIVAGHTRYKAAKNLNLEAVPCIVADDLTDEQIKAFRLADNKVAEKAEWDFDLLSGELDDLLDFDMTAFGFEDDVLAEEPEVVEDDFDAEPPEEPYVKLGDLYQLGNHRLLCGDSTKIDDVEKLMGGELADMLITDPPYNVALGMGGSVDEARKRHRRTDGLVIMNDSMEDGEFYQFLYDFYTCAYAVMKEGAAFYIWHADNEGLNFRLALKNAGFQLRQTLIWNKNTITLGRQDYQWKHEPCLYGWKDGAAHNWHSDRKQSTVIDMNKPAKSELHPTMKPIELFDYQIKNSSKQGENVLDLFGGSGTTLMACEQNGRRSFSMEFDPRYAQVIIERWEQFTGKKAVLLK